MAVAKLMYFDMTGLGEPVRLMLSAANIPFSDVRISKEEWKVIKPSLKWPQLPVLNIDGKALFQSRAICRYISRKSGLAGSDDLEAALADATVDALDDMRHQIVRHYYTPDSPERTLQLKNALQNVVPLYLTRFEQQAVENNGFLVAGKMTWADIMLLAYTDYIGYTLSTDNLVSGYHRLEEIIEKVKKLDGVSRWLAKRPKPIADFRIHFSDP